MRIINTCDYEKTSSFIVDLPFLMGVLDLCSGRTCGGGCGLQEGKLSELNRYLGDKVDLIIHNRTTNADKQTAEGTMANFFAENKVSSFNVNHEGKRDESSFIIGTLGTANGNFRVNCFFRKVQNKYVIHQIRIDKTNE